jgi:hypothetical protein
MKKIKNIFKISIILLLIITACTDDIRDTSFAGNMVLPSEVAATYQITQDNTGAVTITPSANGAVSFNIYFGDATADPAKISQGESVDHIYAEGTYEVKVEALNLSGDTVEMLQQLVVSFQAPQNLVVVIENDAAISKQVNITANADFAAMFEFDSAETGATEPIITGNIGETISYQYLASGIYSVKVTAKGGAIATTEYAVDFEVTEILAPISSASAPPTRDVNDVISIFSDSYADVAGTDFYPNWGQSTLYTLFDLNGNGMLQYNNLNYQGIDIGAEVDASSMEFLRIDIWTPDATTIDIYPLPNGVAAADEKFVTKTLIANEWNSFDIPMSDFTDQGLPINNLKQFKFVGAGSIFIDNFYFYKLSSASTFNDGLLSNGDFQSGSDSWLVGTDDSSSAPVATNSGNTYYSVNVAAAGNPWEVNTSQKVEIIQGNTYTLTFDAWSDGSRSIIAGIGLSADPWSSSVETIDITATRATYTLILSSEDFGAPDARVIFDLGADSGEVNIDNVSLFLGNGNLLGNGNFENASNSWIVGTNDSAPAPVITTNGNSHYFVNVGAAGNPWEVNLSQKVEIIEDKVYTLTFDAWSDIDRPIIAGIGLSADPWSSDTETVDITSSRSTYTLTLSSAGFAAPDARVIFDLGAAVGNVNIDNVSLSIN